MRLYVKCADIFHFLNYLGAFKDSEIYTKTLFNGSGHHKSSSFF